MFRIGASRGAAAVPLTERLPWAYFAARGIVFLKFGGFQRTLRFRGGDAASAAAPCPAPPRRAGRRAARRPPTGSAGAAGRGRYCRPG